MVLAKNILDLGSMDIKLDEGFIVDLSNKEDNFPILLTGCNICAEDHETDECSIFNNLTNIKDTKVQPRAILTLPPSLKVETLSDGSKAVIATECFTMGTQFGPYQAEKCYSLNPFDNFPIKIFGDSENILPDSYLDSRNEDRCNWMCYIPAANNLEEQNLICYQIKLDIFYSVIRDINPGDHLKVWYSTYYAAKIGSKILTPKEEEPVEPNEAEKIQQVAEKLPAKKLGAKEKQNWSCKMCNYSEINVVRFARHLQKHYFKMLQNLYVCNVCNAGFSTEKALKTHRKLEHKVMTEHKPSDIENLMTNKPATPKTEIIGPCLPLPLDNITDSDQLLTMDQLGLANTGIYNDLNDAETLRAILCDDNTKASKIAQEKSIADFSLELVESNEAISKLQAPFYCDICNKLFGNLQYMFIHLKKHTGENLCLHCLQVYTRRENYLRHRCIISNTIIKFNCSYCPKVYFQKKYLERHLQSHIKKYPCETCGKKYKTKYLSDNHNCSISQKKLYSCSQCNRNYDLKIYLQRHIKRCHEDTIKKQSRKLNMCEICAKIFRSPQSLKTHKKQHFEPKYDCRICNKNFYRIDTYNTHLASHATPTEVCNICNQKFKSKLHLKKHQVLHNSNSKYSCEECGKTYARRWGLLDHRKRIHCDNPVTCQDCGKYFKNSYLLTDHKKTYHAVSIHTCHICDKSFPLNKLLTQHIKNYHSNHIYSCKYCPQFFKRAYYLRNHLKRNHPEHKEELVEPVLNIPDKIINKNENNSDAQENSEVLLSIPKTDKNLGKSVYFLEDGTMETTNQIKINNKTLQEREIDIALSENRANEKDNYVFKNSSRLDLKLSNTDGNYPSSSHLMLLQNAEPIPEITNTSVENTEVFLHLPELENESDNEIEPVEDIPPPEILISAAEPEQQITLGKNAFILEDGTIVQPQDQGDLMIFVMNRNVNNQ